jgi:kynureninase
VQSQDGRTLSLTDIVDSFTTEVQLAVLPAVLFTSGQLLDIAAITREAHARGIVIGFDCSHSIGAVPHDLDRDEVDFAFWCNYKWLNAGPGAVGGLYLNRRHRARRPGLAGWWGVGAERRFAMHPLHEPASGAASLHIGTPHILSLAPLLGSLELILEAGGIKALRIKSIALTEFLIKQIDAELAPFGVQIASPRTARERGGHVAVVHPEGWRICQALREEGVVPDFRHPDIIRLSPSPLYTSFEECARAISRLRHILESHSFEAFGSVPDIVP